MASDPTCTVLLDVDGTLVDSTYQHAVAWFLALRRHDVDVVVRDVHRAVGMGGDRLVAAVAGDEVEERLGEDVRAAWGQEFSRLLGTVEPLPGAADLVRALAGAGAAVVWASSGPRDHVEHYLDLLGVRDAVTARTTADDAGSSKPAPDILGVALDRAPSGTRAVCVGDSPWDARAAAGLGLATVGVLTGGFGEDELRGAGCVDVVDTPADLAADVGALLARVREPRP